MLVMQLTLLIHNVGKAVVAEYSCFDIADQKSSDTISLARSYNFPLNVTVEK